MKTAPQLPRENAPEAVNSNNRKRPKIFNVNPK
jgi:hypothetical protein